MSSFKIHIEHQHKCIINSFLSYGWPVRNWPVVTVSSVSRISWNASERGSLYANMDVDLTRSTARLFSLTSVHTIISTYTETWNCNVGNHPTIWWFYDVLSLGNICLLIWNFSNIICLRELIYSEIFTIILTPHTSLNKYVRFPVNAYIKSCMKYVWISFRTILSNKTGSHRKIMWMEIMKSSLLLLFNFSEVIVTKSKAI